MSRAAMQQALEAIESDTVKFSAWTEKMLSAAAALRAALAEPEQEPKEKGADASYASAPALQGSPLGEQREGHDRVPLAASIVAWRTFDGEGGWDYRTYEDNENYRDEYIKRNGEKYASWVEPLYTAPTPQREHITDGSPCWCNPDVIEEDGGNVIIHNYDDNWQQYAKPGETAQQCIERHRAEQDALMKLYATPRRPLTDEELEPLLDAVDSYDITQYDLVKFARAIERAHGITGETK